MNRSSNLLRIGLPMLSLALVLVIAIVRVGSDDTGNGENDTNHENARLVEPVSIDSVDIRLAESFPVQAFVEVSGYLPDPCWEPMEPHIVHEGSRFDIEILAERDADEFCPQVIEDYDTSISLGPVDPGDYVVRVNSVEEQFRVD